MVNYAIVSRLSNSTNTTKALIEIESIFNILKASLNKLYPINYTTNNFYALRLNSETIKSTHNPLPTSYNHSHYKSYLRWLLTAGFCLSPLLLKKNDGLNIVHCDNPFHSSVFCWGSGMNGQLGNGETNGKSKPTMIKEFNLNPSEWITSCVAGKHHSSCISNKGKVFVWGRAQDNLLGHDLVSGSFQATPRSVEALQDQNLKVTQIATGYNHMLALTDQGHVYSWGSKSTHQCGREDNQNSDPVSIWSGRQKSMAVKVGRIFGLIENEEVIQIACGKNHSMALSKDGSLFAWGSNIDSQIGPSYAETVPSPIKLDTSMVKGRISQISCGNTSSAILTEDGNVYTWGLDSYGQLGHGKQQSRVAEPKLVRNLSSYTIKKIVCGDFHMGAIDQNGEIYLWGYNREGQCGHGDFNDKSLPKKLEALSNYKARDVSCGGGHTAIILEDGRMFVFGRGQEGQLGREGFIESMATYRNLPVEVKFFDELSYRIISVYCGGEHTMALVEPLAKNEGNSQ